MKILLLLINVMSFLTLKKPYEKRKILIFSTIKTTNLICLIAIWIKLLHSKLKTSKKNYVKAVSSINHFKVSN